MLIVAEGLTLGSALNIAVSFAVLVYGFYVITSTVRYLPHDAAVPILRTVWVTSILLLVLIALLTAASIASRLDPTRDYSAWVAVVSRLVIGVIFYKVHSIGRSVWRRRPPSLSQMEDDRLG